MTIRKRVGSVLFTAAATAAVVGMSIGPALASTTHLTVKVSRGGSYTAKAGTTILTDGSGASAISVTCTSSKASGKIASGTHRGSAPVKIGTAKALSFSRCTGETLPVTTKVKSTPYSVEVTSKTNSKGETDVIITGVKVDVSLEGCSFTVTGSAPGYLNNSKHTLNMTSKLPVKQAKGVKAAKLTISGVPAGECFDVIHNNDHPSYKATYKVSPKMTIKSS